GRERHGVDRGLPQIAVDPDGRHSRGCELGRQSAVARATRRGQSQNEQSGSDNMRTGHRRSLTGGTWVQRRYSWSRPPGKLSRAGPKVVVSQQQLANESIRLMEPSGWTSYIDSDEQGVLRVQTGR